MRPDLAEANRARVPRVAGVALPLFSLRGEDDFGTGEILDLIPFVDWLAEWHQRVVQLLPLNETAPGETSPYAALSAFALDPAYISAARLEDVRASRQANDWRHSSEALQLREHARASPKRAKQQASTVKLRLLEWGFEEFESNAPTKRARDFESFRERNAHWLDDYCLFRLLKELQGWSSWEQWPAQWQSRGTAVRDDDRCRQRQRFFAYVQWVADEQWAAVRAHAHHRGVLLKGDLPFVCARDSADVWAQPQLFDLSSSAGAPPDDFSDTGQAWGLPLYAWQAHQDSDFTWWRQRARQAAQLYDLFRIDHVVGLFRTYAIPVGTGGTSGFVPAAEEEQHQQGHALITALLQEATATAALIAEDLGTVPDWVRAVLDDLGVPGYRVFRWERRDGVFLDPRAYPELSVATTGTHDTDTAVTWWQGLRVEERNAVQHTLGLTAMEGDGGDALRAWPLVHAALLQRLYESGSLLTILPIQDLFSWTERINVPATVDPANWTYRLPEAGSRLEAREDVRTQLERLRQFIDDSGRGGHQP
jgi:4-alpha-glucanotransferase